MAMLISKFHRIIQSKVVWGVFAVLICIAFVGVYTPGSKSRSAARRDQKEGQLAGRLFGEEVSRAEFAHAYQSVRLNYTLQYGPFRITAEIDNVLRQATWQRLAMLKKARELGMSVTPEQIVSMIQMQPVFRNRETGQFDPNVYASLLPQIRTMTGMLPKDVESHFADEVLLQKAARIPEQGVLITEHEIRKAFHLYTDKLTVKYASLPRSLAGIPEVTEEDAEKYYNMHPEEFRMPEKRMVDYVRFPVADHLDSVEVTDQMVADYYENNKQRYLKTPAEDTPADAEPEYQPLEEVQDSITDEYRQALAREIAADLADELVAELADETATLESASQKLGLEITANTPPFALTDSVKGIDSSAPFQRAAFNLEMDEAHYYSDPVIGRDCVYVIALKKKLESFLPAFDFVRDDAMESAKLAAAENAYIEKAEQIHSDIQQALKAGTSFSDAASKYNLRIKKTVSFDVSTELEDEFSDQIKGAALLCDEGKLTELIATPDEYLVAYVAEKEAGDEAAALSAMRSELVSNLSRQKASQLVAAWQEALLEEAELEDLLPRAEDES